MWGTRNNETHII